MKTNNLIRLLISAMLAFASAMSLYGNQITTVTAITGGPNPGTANANVTLTATVFPQQTVPPPPVPTGTVTFTDNLNNQYTTTLVNGAGVLILQPPAGTYTYTAVYNGDTNYFSSPASGPFIEKVDPGTVTNLTISANPGVYGQPLTITATVTGQAPTGRVTFYDNVTVIGVATLNSNGVASLTTHSLPAGLRDIAAFYSGDANNITSTSTVLTEGILPEPGLGFGPTQTYALGNGNTGPVTVLSGDLNSDGLQDLVVVNGSGSISVYLGMAGGKFQTTPQTFATGAAPVAGVIGDFNADGILDVAVAGTDGVDVLFGVGDGTFQASVPVNIGSAGSGIATTDFNRDGFPDIVASNAGGTAVTILLSNGDGTFKPSLSCTLGAGVTNPVGLAIGDFNDDSTPDIAVSTGSGVYVLLGSLNVIAGNIYSCGTATQASTAGANSPSLVVKDFTGNGDQDIAVTNFGAGTVSILLGAGNGTFSLSPGSPSAGVHPSAIATGDFNGDGKPDLAVSDGNPTGGMNLFILLGNGDGTFAAPLGYASDASLTGVVTGSFDQNGQADVAAVSSSTNQVDVLLNGFATLSIVLGDGQSAPVSTTFPVGLAVQATGFGKPAAHVPVTFTASNGYFNGLGSSVTVLTDNNGNAIAPPYTANAVQGADPVTATSGGNTITFSLTNDVQPCTFTVTPTSLLFPATGGQATVTVTPSASTCVWSAASSASGIQIGNSTETGNGSVHVLIQQNTTNAPLSESFNVAGQVISVQVQATSLIFGDVPTSAYFFDYANEMYLKGITSGCSVTPLLYCPTQTVTRAQMAVFLVTAVYGPGNIPVDLNQHFTDVPPDAFGFQWIQALHDLGITSGCTPTTYCPNDPVTRAQMAVFIIRMRYGSGANFDFPSQPIFTDVPADGFGFDWIQRMSVDAITAGCGPGLYCPNNSVLRQDMSVFIMKGAFNFGLPPTEPVITSISPSSINSGGATLVTVNAANTAFVQGSTFLNPIPGVTIGALTVTSPTSFTVLLTPAAPEGPQSIWVTTTTLSGSQEAVLPNSLKIPQ